MTMTIEKNMQGTVAELKLTGWLNTENAPVLEAEVNALSEDVTELILDFSGVGYISSAGIRQIVATYKKMSGNILLRNLSGEIMNVIKLTGLDKRLKIE